MTTTIDIDLADILEQKYPHGFHAPADIDISTFLEFADDDWTHQLNIEALLADDRLIAIIWNTQIILDQRPDLTDYQAWAVLQACQRDFQNVTGPMRESIRRTAEAMCPKPTGKASLRASLARLAERIEALPEDETTDPAAYGSAAAEIDSVETLAKGA